MLKKVAWIVAISLVVAALSAVTVLASGIPRTPAQIVSELTGKSLDQVETARAAGESYAQQAKAAGKFDAFKTAALENCKIRLDDMVKRGKMTQEKADAKYKAMQEWMKDWDGTKPMHGGKGCKGMHEHKGMPQVNATGNLNNAKTE